MVVQRLILALDEFDSSLDVGSVSLGCARHLFAIHGQVTFVESHGSSWPWMRCEGEDVPFYDSIDGMLVVFIMADPACYLVAGLVLAMPCR